MADNFKTLKCPACQKEMVKVFVPKEGINVDICLDGCGGIYFDNRELNYFDEQHESVDEIMNALDGKTFIKTDESLPRVCPVCGAKMVKNYTSTKRKIQIDECYSCGGKFLDFGELEAMRDEYPTEALRSADFQKEIYETVGLELMQLDQQHAEALAKRSFLQKMFDKAIGRD